MLVIISGQYLFPENNLLTIQFLYLLILPFLCFEQA